MNKQTFVVVAVAAERSLLLYSSHRSAEREKARMVFSQISAIKVHESAKNILIALYRVRQNVDPARQNCLSEGLSEGL